MYDIDIMFTSKPLGLVMNQRIQQDIIGAAEALPLVEKDGAGQLVLTGAESLLMWRRLDELSSDTRVQIEAQVDHVIDEIAADLEFDPDAEEYILTETDLHAALAKMAIRAGSQALYGAGLVLSQVQELEQIPVQLENPHS